MITIHPATPSETETVFTFVEKFLHELSDEGDEFSSLDREKVLHSMAGNQEHFHPFLAKDENGEVVGVMTVVETFAIYAGAITESLTSCTSPPNTVRKVWGNNSSKR